MLLELIHEVHLLKELFLLIWMIESTFKDCCKVKNEKKMKTPQFGSFFSYFPLVFRNLGPSTLHEPISDIDLLKSKSFVLV